MLARQSRGDDEKYRIIRNESCRKSKINLKNENSSYCHYLFYYQVSKKFYTEILGLNIIREVYREERQSYKLDLAIGDDYVIELFSFPNPPKDLLDQKVVV
jgi:hypothetical protein